jgi:hypothetical protein
MKLKCSANHRIDTRQISMSGSMGKKPGDKCGIILTYDRMTGTKYCQRRLKINCTHTIRSNE